MDKMQRMFKYAVDQGYTGTINQYVDKQYQGYCETCKRCDTCPMSKQDWLAAQDDQKVYTA